MCYLILTLLNLPIWITIAESIFQNIPSSTTEELFLFGSLLWVEKGKMKIGIDEALVVDLITQGCLLIGFCYLEYSSFKVKQNHKGIHIEYYTIEIQNLPLVPVYILLPQLEAYLKSHFSNRLSLCPV